MQLRAQLHLTTTSTSYPPLATHLQPTMFVRTLRATRALRAPIRYVSTATTSNQVPANDPVERAVKPNVSETNAVPTSSEGSFDKVLQENVADGERMRSQQAPNYKGIWSRSQQPREIAMSGPRFEQSIMEDQVRRVRSCGGLGGWKCKMRSIG
jgi:NADH dehydrogenase (ubiquinone) Fe-S protein 6